MTYYVVATSYYIVPTTCYIVGTCKYVVAKAYYAVATIYYVVATTNELSCRSHYLLSRGNTDPIGRITSWQSVKSFPRASPVYRLAVPNGRQSKIDIIFPAESFRHFIIVP